MPREIAEHTALTEVASALAHPLRFRILQAMNAPERSLSPNEFSLETGHPLGNCAYHFRVLHGQGCIEISDEQKRRGATEHFFQPTKKALLWTREWAAMPPVLRQAIAASVLSGFVETVGNAIDAGCFDGKNPHIAWNSFYSDEEGIEALMKIWNDALADALALEEEVAKRLREKLGQPSRLISFGSAAFPSVPRTAS